MSIWWGEVGADSCHLLLKKLEKSTAVREKHRGDTGGRRNDLNNNNINDNILFK